MVHQRGNQRDTSPHYVLLYSDDEHSGEEDSIPLQARTKTTSLPRKIEVINIQLKSDDTLQALALRYRCTISELKRINKIHKENEIHAKRLIKVPVQPFSLLTENLDQNLSPSEGQSEISIPGCAEAATSTANTEALIDLSRSVISEPPKAEINAIILNSVCEPLSSYNNSDSVEIVNTECDQLLTATESNTSSPHLTDTFKCSGDDCGLSWTQLLGFSLLLGFAGPIIIYILIATEFTSKNHTTESH